MVMATGEWIFGIKAFLALAGGMALVFVLAALILIILRKITNRWTIRGGVPGSKPPVAPEEAVAQQDRLAQFQRTLVELTPRLYMTWGLIGVNALVFILMVVSGVNPVQPTIPDLLRWGADFAPKTVGPEWWRALTCMFVHVGILHILFNMWVLATAGPLVERMLGNVGFLLAYLVAGLAGSLASLFWNPLLVGAGASGAVFGIYGALLGLLLRGGGTVPARALAQLRNSGVAFILYNLVYGMAHANVDSAAHIGGLAAGFLCGIVLGQPFARTAPGGRPVRNLVVGGLGALMVIGGMVGLNARYAGLAKVQSELERFKPVEDKVLGAFNGAVTKAKRKELSDAAFADLLEREVLPEWRATAGRLRALRQIPPPLQRRVTSLLDYMRQREEAWALLVQALREGSLEKAQQAVQKQKQADAAAKRFADGADE